MISFTIQPSLDSLSKTLTDDITKQTKEGLGEAASWVPVALRANFIAEGERGGNDKWRRLTYWTQGSGKNLTVHGSIQYRQTLPRTQNKKALDAYYAKHKPLQDTGALMNSAHVLGMKTLGGVYASDITMAAYGAGHDDGSAKTPAGNPVFRRGHMFIVEGEDTRELDTRFEGAWK